MYRATLYTGWTNDLKTSGPLMRARLIYKVRLPVTLFYFEKFNTKEEAMRREWEIKHLTRAEKLALYP